MDKVVFIERLEGELFSLKCQFSRAFEAVSLNGDFKDAKGIFIKPNLTYPVYKKGVTTRIEFIETLVEALRAINPGTKIYIGEGEGGYNSFSMSDALENMGFHKLKKRFSNVEIINLSKIPAKEIEIETSKGLFKIKVPAIFFDRIDFSISCPVPKVHCMTKVTLSYKNQWGCLPDVMRLNNHYMFDYIISKISQILKFRYAFLDGKYGLDVNGPMAGEAVEVNWFVASNSLGAFDTVVCGMMGFDWRKINYLRIAAEYGFIPKKGDIRIIGEIGALQKKFVLKRDFWNYPALAAFRSKKLTHLFYLSRWAKLLHEIMYAFRKRPIS